MVVRSKLVPAFEKKNKGFIFIGKNVEIVSSSNNTLVGTQGVIVDETKNTFIIFININIKKTIMKKGTIFVVDNKKFYGENLIKRIEDRIKNI